MKIAAGYQRYITRIPAVLMMCILISCNNSPDEDKNIKQENNITDSLSIKDSKQKNTHTDSSSANQIRRNNIEEGSLLSNIKTHEFSDINKKDTFKLVLSGQSIIDGHVTFQIIDFNNNIILNDTFSALDLIYEELNYVWNDTTPSTKQEEDSITKRVKYFFDDGNFVQPAINPWENYDKEYNNLPKDIWKSIKADPASIGFFYSEGGEGGCGIAYSKKDKKAVYYFCSD